MNILRVSTLSLTLAVAAFIIAMLMPVTTWAGLCDKHPEHKNCQPPPPPADTFSVGVDLDGTGADTVTVTEVKMNGNRQGLNGTISLDLGLLPREGLCTGFAWGALDDLAQFSISTAKIPPSESELTYVEANIYDFTMSSTGDARITLSFVPDVPDGVTINDALFPTATITPNVLTGDEIGVSISPDHGSCSGMIDQDWTITVTKD